MVFVGNLRKGAVNPSGKRFRVDRSSPLGNPFWMQSEFHRDAVCDEYDRWFHESILKGGPLTPLENKNDSIRKAWDYLLMLLDEARKGDIVLMCWCTPKRCHAQTISKWITEQLEGTTNDNVQGL
ncbi:Uncharacterised protein [uncultured archaeon]|nr:Uncharacterised protein [uncultured archaeon]